MTVEGQARSPLEHRRPDLARATANMGGDAEIVEVAFPAQVDLRIDPRHARLLEHGLPLEPNTVTHMGDRATLWLGPDEWLVVGPPGSCAGLIAELEGALDGVHHSVIDVSANRAVVELHGAARHELLSKGCSLDLATDRWPPGTCAQTLLAGVQVILEERPRATRLFFRPSFCNYVTDWFLDATVEFRMIGESFG